MYKEKGKIVELRAETKLKEGMKTRPKYLKGNKVVFLAYLVDEKTLELLDCYQGSERPL
jgi:hypothetical protein